MKNLIIFFSIMLFCSVSFAQDDETSYWVCSQPGYFENTLTYAVSYVFEDKISEYDEKELEFVKIVGKKTKGKFSTLDSSSCRYFDALDKARKYQKRMLEKARQNYSILWIQFGTLKR